MAFNRYLELPLAYAQLNGIAIFGQLYESKVLSKQELAVVNAVIEAVDYGKNSICTTSNVVVIDYHQFNETMVAYDEKWASKKNNAISNVFSRLCKKGIMSQHKAASAEYQAKSYINDLDNTTTLLSLNKLTPTAIAQLTQSQTQIKDKRNRSTNNGENENHAIIVDGHLDKVGTAMSVVKLAERLLPVSFTDDAYSASSRFSLSVPHTTERSEVDIQALGGGDVIQLASVDDLRFLEYYYQQINTAIVQFFESKRALNEEFNNEFLFYYRDIEKALFKNHGSHNRKVINDTNLRLHATEFTAVLANNITDNTIFKAMHLLSEDSKENNIIFKLISLKGSFQTRDDTEMVTDMDGVLHTESQLNLFDNALSNTNGAKAHLNAVTKEESRNYFVLKLPAYLANRVRMMQSKCRAEEQINHNEILSLYFREVDLLPARRNAGLLMLLRDRFYAFFTHSRSFYNPRPLNNFLCDLNASITKENASDYVERLINTLLINNLVIHSKELYITERSVKCKQITFALENCRFLVEINNETEFFTVNTKRNSHQYTITARETVKQERPSLAAQLDTRRKAFNNRAIRFASKMHAEILNDEPVKFTMKYHQSQYIKNN